MVFPGNDRAASPVAYKLRIMLIIGLITDGGSIGAPQGIPRGVYPLDINVRKTTLTSKICPRDDRATSPVADELKSILCICGIADCGAIGTPLGDPRGIDPLGVDIVIPTSKIYPRDDRAASLIADEVKRFLGIYRGANGYPISDPCDTFRWEWIPHPERFSTTSSDAFSPY
ncbi:MAG: hypothetical protein RBG13Loki_1859 [Promethearchaeota archaeon CR_4]|nr:MAG: hypothetical protein RBG13Loki_1859 [Candidatus Lokiarchaeota archaeon CR_4]